MQTLTSTSDPLPIPQTLLHWALLAILPFAGGCAYRSGQTALDRYVHAPDPHYAFRHLSTAQGQGVRTHILEMTSQSWLTTNEVNRTLWKHWLLITVPNEARAGTALLFIGGGGNDGAPPKEADARMTRIAQATRSVVAELKMVPNQPLIFAGETQGRSEDSLIAYTWDKFLRTGDERWPARLPMTKSAVRAMDTVTAFCRTPEGGGLDVGSFVVAGGSKRGWTTWTTAATDKRVIAAAPIVIDMLNIEPSFIHHWETYGFYAPAVGDYVAMGIMDWQGTPEYRRLMKIEEPFEYRDRLTLPKFLINATGDQFFLPDSSQFYFDRLSGTRHLRYVPNADHSLDGSDAIESLVAWYHSLLNGQPLPRFTWAAHRDGTLHVKVVDRPTRARLWQATNPDARDFRVETIGKCWTATDLTPGSDGSYRAQVAPPARGWTAYLVELTYERPGGPAPLKFTTEVVVSPDRTPYRFRRPERPASSK